MALEKLNNSNNKVAMIKNIAILISSILVLGGCSQVAITQAQKEMNETYEPLMGCTEEEVIVKVGAPASIQRIDGLTIYKYQKIHGFSGNFSGGFDIAQDKAEIVFKNGRATSWKGQVQR